ncbi:MAG TPA: alpha/beta hydrolase [Xanthobacteraceae bacterium]|nr:alpha/beta hydrolase [Xanthobacteraceae bacterium]
MPAITGSIDQFHTYLDATFASLPSSKRADVTASVAPQTFAARFAGGAIDATGSASDANPILGSIKAASKTRAAALPVDDGAPAAQNRYRVASYASGTDDALPATPFGLRSEIRVPPIKQAATSLVPFDSAPFPYEGAKKESYSDPSVLLHIPKGFDVNRPSVMIVFFHGHGATLTRDVLTRQQVPAQISEAGVNAVLVAPQLAYNAADSSPGKLWEPGAFARFVREAGDQLTRLYGDPRAARTFANMPIVIVAYSGGYLTAASSLSHGGLKNRVRGVVLLDALYGELDKFADFITTNRTAFFVSAYTHSTKRRNVELENILSERDVTIGSALKPNRLEGSVTFLPAGNDVRHRDFVNHAWAAKPIKDLLSRMTEYRL